MNRPGVSRDCDAFGTMPEAPPGHCRPGDLAVRGTTGRIITLAAT